jgi:hypothetical protein
MSHPERNFLHLEGMIHEIDIAPSGPPEDPWPFCLMVNNGHETVSALLHREDAQEIVDWLTARLEAPKTTR